MSGTEVERFVSELKDNAELRAELSSHASGLGSVVEFAKDKGYDISLDEASAYIQGQAGRDLSDEQLDGIAGGKGSDTATQVQQTVEAVQIGVIFAAAVAIIVVT
jgi:predicted ribosomally synthesized peptide with nif11-like leader